MAAARASALVRDYEDKIRHSLNSLSWLIYRINSR